MTEKEYDNLCLEIGDCILQLNILLSKFAGSPNHIWRNQLLEIHQIVMNRYWELSCEEAKASLV